ncbi:LapA family protein [Variovorax dokdonensis]|uniref:LapA family protein n=1 Tax=Variovorax dokdonensis TaxID=344883 RepID=A0ABT7N8G5_9BURK|nr:LapA family protein [Variovorax dokdonensis]MDM0044223.1 LapA family protein [Variovorax dokdonensis]
MRLRTGIVLLVVLLIAALAALNWTQLSTPTTMSLGFMETTAPLGLIMLGLTIALGVICLAYVLYLQSTVMLETRRHSKEMQVQRELADKAEASRFTELRTYLDAQEQARAAQLAEAQRQFIARVEHLEAAFKSRVDQSDNTTAAHIGQLEDRIERQKAPTDINPQI